MNRPEIIFIMGQTATGKSAFAVEIAKELNGEIISADSRQVYKFLDVGSGKITKEEMKGIRHHMLDVANPNDTFSVAEYERLALGVIENIQSRDKLPIVVGGSGFYLQAVLWENSFAKVKPNELLRKELDDKTTEELFELLCKKDIEIANAIDSKNKRRLIRAIEIIETEGVYTKLQPKIRFKDFLVLEIDTENIDKKIEERLRLRWNGIKKEAEKLKDIVEKEKLVSLGLEYKAIAYLLENKKDEVEIYNSLLKEIKQYAKRQKTWIKSHFEKIEDDNIKRFEKHLSKDTRLFRLQTK